MKMKKIFILITATSVITTSCKNDNPKNTIENKEIKDSTQLTTIENNTIDFPTTIKINDLAQNPEGIEYNKNDQTFLLSSINAGPIVKVNFDGTYKPFTSGENFPLSTAGLQIDYKHNRLLVAGFNGTEIMDEDPSTKGASFLRIYNLESGLIEKDINLSSVAPEAAAYFANDIAVDNDGNVYISDWYAGLIYKVDFEGNPSVFWRNKTGITSGPNGLDFNSDGYLLVSILSVNNKGLYSDYGLVKIPLDNPSLAKLVNIEEVGYTGFDGMVLNSNGHVIGVTNNGVTAGGNTLLELTSDNNWESAKILNKKTITASTTVAITPNKKMFVINQDFLDNFKESWTIEQIKF